MSGGRRMYPTVDEKLHDFAGWAVFSFSVVVREVSFSGLEESLCNTQIRVYDQYARSMP